MTTLTRSTMAITSFVQASRRLAALAMQMKQAESELAALRDEVLDQIGEGRTVKVDGALATLTRRETQSVKMLDPDNTLRFWIEHGLKVSTRTPEYVAPSSFRSEVLKGSVPEDLYRIETTIDVNVI
jgi:hypothetical protein